MVKIEAVAHRCSVKKVFLEIPQNSLENTCARASFLIKLQVFSKNTFFYRTPPMAASVTIRLKKAVNIFFWDLIHPSVFWGYKTNLMGIKTLNLLLT